MEWAREEQARVGFKPCKRCYLAMVPAQAAFKARAMRFSSLTAESGRAGRTLKKTCAQSAFIGM